MKVTAVIAAAFAAVSTGSYATEIYDSYDAFYSAQAGAVFNEPIKRDTGVVYSRAAEEGSYTVLHATLAGKAFRIHVAANHITVNGRAYTFAGATTLPNEPVGNIYPDAVNVFISKRAGNRPALLCVDGHGSGSGEADRYQQIFLLVDPLGPKPIFLHLPALLSSCRAIVATKEGQLAFPKNSYLLDEAQGARTGLLVSYLTFEGGHFTPTGNAIRLRFASPENPFKFSRQEELEPKAP
jgi:hypothetical protein